MRQKRRRESKMERNYEFKIGQSVKMRTDDDLETWYGKVIDKTSITVFIQWNHQPEKPIEYERGYSPWNRIKIIP